MGELQLREPREGPGPLLGDARTGLECELHRFQRRRGTPEQLTGASDAGVRGNARPLRRLPVDHGERLVVATELDERVGESAERRGMPRREAERTACMPSGLAETVLGRR